MQSIGKAGGH